MTVDTIATLKFPPPPKLPEAITSLDDVTAMAEKLRKYFNSQSVSYNQLYNILHEGSLVEQWQIHNLTVDNLLAGQILTDKLYIGSTKFTLDGTLTLLTIDDDQTPPQRRVEMGAFGSGADYGINIYDEDGNTILSQTGLGLGVVKDENVASGADIDGSKLADLSIENAKIANATIAAAKIISVTANQVTTGTLTCNSTAVAISVTSGGAVILSNGADLLMKAHPTNNISQFRYQTSTGADMGEISYYPASDYFLIQSINTDLILAATGSGKFLGLTATTYIEASADFVPVSDNTKKLGGSGLRFSDIYATTTHFGDIYFGNNFAVSEMDKVYPDVKDKGLVFLNDANEPIMTIMADGTIHAKGEVIVGSSIFEQSNAHILVEPSVVVKRVEES